MARYLTTCALSIILGAVLADITVKHLEHRYHQRLGH